MAQINLLPVTAQKKRRTKLKLNVKLEPFIFLFAGVVLSVAVVWLVLNVRISAEQKQLADLDRQLQALKFSSNQLQQLAAEKDQLSAKVEFINQQLVRGVLWARNLNILSNLVPEGIWFKKIALKTGKDKKQKRHLGLEVSGAAISFQDQEMIDLISKFMTALKNNEVFAGQFSAIQLISSKRSKFGKMEVMDFELACLF
ncbi:PilN domain-containing protein [Candidatus Omnitrophota bacterium]